jgi:hypothetical protein
MAAERQQRQAATNAAGIATKKEWRGWNRRSNT